VEEKTSEGRPVMLAELKEGGESTLEAREGREGDVELNFPNGPSLHDHLQNNAHGSEEQIIFRSTPWALELISS